MKGFIYSFIVLAILLSCSKDEADKNTDLHSSWHLTEQLIDPGDGSGTFQSVESNKMIHFYNDGSVTSNGQLQSLSAESDFSSSGIYSFSDSTIIVNHYDNSTLSIRFEMENSYLILFYPCIEPCIAKYEKE